MIEQILKLMGGRISTGPDWVVLQDGDRLEILIRRHGDPLTLLSVAHYGVDDEGHNVKVDPLPIRITIEGGKGSER